jgi:hypothetical protein
LEGEVTGEGLWLTSTVEGAAADRFRVAADYVGRDGGATMALPECGVAGSEVGLARFERRGLVEEYSVSVDGVRQDFVVLEPPGGAGPLRVELRVEGAKVETLAGAVDAPSAGSGDPAYTKPVGRVPSRGARLVLETSGRKLAYSRLRVVDATGRELAARMDVVGRRGFHSVSEGLGEAGEPVERVLTTARLAVVVEDADAVYPVRIDPTFSDENWVSIGGLRGTDGTVHSAIVDAAGDLYIGGTFTIAGDVLATNIAKWDGSAWSALGSGLDDQVCALAVSGSDLLYVGGSFKMAGGKLPANMVKAIIGETSGVAPTITSQPQNQSCLVGAAVTFTVTASGTAPLTYQWRFNDQVLSGATSASLTLNNVQLSDAGDYTVVVTNAAGTVTSAGATLAVVSGLTLGEALDAPELVWTTGGDVPWFAQTSVTHDGVDAAQSGAIAESQQSCLETTLIGPGMLTFWWRTGSEGWCDFLMLAIDGIPAGMPTQPSI